MKRFYLVILFICMSFLAPGCNPPSGPGGGGWFFTHHTGNPHQSILQLRPAHFLALKKDGNYTCNLGQLG
jgi:hypothetical protein